MSISSAKWRRIGAAAPASAPSTPSTPSEPSPAAVPQEPSPAPAVDHPAAPVKPRLTEAAVSDLFMKDPVFGKVLGTFGGEVRKVIPE